MARICFVFLLMAAAVLLVESDVTVKRSCVKNEQWNECGTVCEPSCKDPDQEDCTADCVAGCRCKPGFLRREDGRCVRRNRC